MREKLMSALAGLTLAVAAYTPASAQLPRNPRSVLPQNFQSVKQGEYNQLTHPEILFPDFYDIEVEKFYHDDAIKLDPTLIYPVVGPVRENPCRNGDFETGLDTNEWDGGFGSIDGSGNILWGSFATGIAGGAINLPTSRQTLVSYALDPNAPIYTTPSSASTRAVRIGNMGIGNGAELLSKTFTVSSSQSLLTFSYAMVLEAPMSHPAAERPAFRVRVVDAATNIEITGVADLGNGSNVAIADNSNPYFQTTNGGAIVYRDWSCAQINLSRHVGRRVTVQFITNDCAWRGHWGYAYLDNLCGDCGGNNYNLELNKVDCDKSTFCFKYRLPRVNNITGSVRITMYLYQNGILKDSVVSPVLTSDSLYCFTLSPTTLASLDPSLGGYDIVAKGNFAISGSSLAPIQLFTPPDGMRRGVNNDCELVQVAPCCPGRNLVVNGAFEAGNTGFTSQYTYTGTVAANSVSPGRYSILTDAQALTVSSTWNPACPAYSRHFVANGNTGGSGWRAVWQQAIPVTRGKTYKFCGDFKNLPQCAFDIKPVIGIVNSGTGFGGTPTTSQTINVPAGGSCNWTRIEQTITATSNTIYLSVCLRETGAGDGNDFAMDNLSLVELQPVSFMDIQYSRTPFNLTPTTYNMSITALTPLPPDCQNYWQVEELTSSFLVVPGTDVIDPLVWRPLTTNTFNGYVGTSTLSGSAPGVFSNNKIYRFAYGRSCKCASLSRRYEIYGPAVANKMSVGGNNNLSSGPQLLQSGYFDEDGNAVPSSVEDGGRGSIKIYPNPTSDAVTIERPTSNESLQVKVFNLHGQVVKTVSFGAGEAKVSISLSGLASGAYMTHIVSADGTIVHAEKITKL